MWQARPDRAPSVLHLWYRPYVHPPHLSTVALPHPLSPSLHKIRLSVPVADRPSLSRFIMRRTLRLLHAAHGNLLDEVDDEELNCGSGGGDNTDTGLRVASLFVILITSLLGALFPVLARRTKWLSRRIPTYVFDTAKYFGSGVIVRIVLLSRIHHTDLHIDRYCSHPPS